MAQRFKKIYKVGFTLIELLVVIAIIGLLAGIILQHLSQARAEARDALRMQQLRQIANAFELYYLDNGHFPIENDIDGGGLINNPNGSGKIGLGKLGVGNPIDAAIAPYLPNIPLDPRHDEPLPGANPDNVVDRYYYYYDGYHQCRFNNVGGSPLEVVIFAKAMEIPENANRSELCTQTDIEMNMSNSSNAHYIILSDLQLIGSP